MRELTIRMLATGVSTAVLILASLIAESGFNANNTETAGAVGYTILSLVLLLVAIGFCAKTILNGLKALFEFRANSDSAAAVACVAVLCRRSARCLRRLRSAWVKSTFTPVLRRVFCS